MKLGTAYFFAFGKRNRLIHIYRVQLSLVEQSEKNLHDFIFFPKIFEKLEKIATSHAHIL